MSASKCIKMYCLTLVLAAYGMFETGPAQNMNSDGSSVNKLSVLVTNKSKQPVTDLTENDFIVLDNGKRQTISFFQKKDIPVSYGLIVDNTGSMRPSAEAAQLVAKAIVGNHRPHDKAFIVRLVDGHSERITDWTTDKARLLSALNSLTHGSGAAPLIDSIRDCSEYIGKDQESRDIAQQRRGIVIITDGLDRNSTLTMALLLEQLHKDNLQVFAVGMRPPAQRTVPRSRFPTEQSLSFLNALTKETGGRSLFPISESELYESAELISSYMRSQYVIGYNGVQNAGEGSLHEILVSLVNAPRREEYLVSARLRYATRGR